MDPIDGTTHGLTRSLAISDAEAVEVVGLDDLDGLKATRYLFVGLTGRSLGLGEELHGQEVASESHGSPVGTACLHHVAFAAQKDIVFEGSLSKKRRLASDSVTEVPHYGEYDVTDVLCDVHVTISLGLSCGKEILGAQTKEVVPDNMPDECTGTTHNVNSFPPSCHEGSSSSGKRGFKRTREVCPRGCSNMNGVGQCAFLFKWCTECRRNSRCRETGDYSGAKWLVVFAFHAGRD
ncbi:hypothetical protein ACE6H2_015658 [Prunus campanulata]